jgi:DNA-binding response OmpR family regulator
MVSGPRISSQPLLDRRGPANDAPVGRVGKVCKILVIEDDPQICELIALSLTRQGFAVSTAENGRTGLLLFADEAPDLVISDILMPDVEGIEVLLALKASPSAPKVIAISGGGRLGGRDFLRWATHLGADAVMAKPFRMSSLVERVQELLGQTPVSAWPSAPQAHRTVGHLASMMIAAPELSRACG